MTRTEERLRDALGAAAARVRDDRLRPLPAPETRPRWQAQRRHMGWLGPAAAAVSVLLIVALALTLVGQSHKTTPSVSYPALPAASRSTSPTSLAVPCRRAVQARRDYPVDLDRCGGHPGADARHPGISADAAERRRRPGRPNLLYRVPRGRPAEEHQPDLDLPAHLHPWRFEQLPGMDQGRSVPRERPARRRGKHGCLAGRQQTGLHRRHTTAGRPELAGRDLRRRPADRRSAAQWQGRPCPGRARRSRSPASPGSPDGRSLVFRAVWCTARPELRRLPGPRPASPGTAPHRGPLPRRRGQGRKCSATAATLLAAASRLRSTPSSRTRSPGPDGELTLAVLSGPADAKRPSPSNASAHAGRAGPACSTGHARTAPRGGRTASPSPPARQVHTC